MMTKIPNSQCFEEGQEDKMRERDHVFQNYLQIPVLLSQQNDSHYQQDSKFPLIACILHIIVWEAEGKK